MATLTDGRGRVIRYARISLTDRCNYRCTYCMPSDGVPQLAHESIMRFEDILFLSEVLEELGVRKIRFTGGEPLVRRGTVPFLKRFRASFPTMAIALTTNGSLLSPYAEDLASVRLSGLNVSLDTVDARKFRSITRMGEIEDVIRGLDAAAAAGISNIKTNTVLIRGFNDDEVRDIAALAWSKGATPRLIEFMPLGDDVWDSDKFVSAREILTLLADCGEWVPVQHGDGEESPLGPAQYYVDVRSGRRIGVIEAVTNHFCDRCNRLRITASGRARACLFSPRDADLTPFLQARDREALRQAVTLEVALKPEYWENVQDGELNMSGIGG